jgi:tRNA threonylcarbamoyladenosine biosynthesis protein TsaB
VTPRALVDELARGPGRPVVLVGDGVGVLAALGEESLAGIACIAPLAQRAPSAVTVGDLARAALARGEASDPAALVPLYVRRSEAEIARERRRHVGDCH